MDNPVDVLTQRFQETTLGSKSAARKVLKNFRRQELDYHHCLTCQQDFDNYHELKKHVNKKKHRKSMKEIKAMINNFIQERLDDEGITTYDEAKQMFEEDGSGARRPFSVAEKSTWCRYLVFLSLMETFNR